MKEPRSGSHLSGLSCFRGLGIKSRNGDHTRRCCRKLAKNERPPLEACQKWILIPDSELCFELEAGSTQDSFSGARERMGSVEACVAVYPAIVLLHAFDSGNHHRVTAGRAALPIFSVPFRLHE